MTIWRLGEKAGESRFFHVRGSEINEQPLLSAGYTSVSVMTIWEIDALKFSLSIKIYSIEYIKQ
jgi:hypothetical protein